MAARSARAEPRGPTSAKTKSATRSPGVREALSLLVGGLSDGERRPGQLAMAEAVARALERGDHVAVAAGTGTGKSFAYLVAAVVSGKKVVVATATKALQDQLASKDLPRVAAAIDSKLRWAVLKGRSNYVCRQRLAEMETLGHQERLGEPDPRLGEGRDHRRGGRSRRPGAGVRPGQRLRPTPDEQVRRIVAWADVTEAGDRAELDFEPDGRVWSNLSVTSDECPGAGRCPSGSTCFAEKARAKAASADIVVVNLHLLGAHLRSGGAVLPPHEALVVDEAHELEDVMAESLGCEISAGRVRAVAAAARTVLKAGGPWGRAGPGGGGPGRGGAGDPRRAASRAGADTEPGGPAEDVLAAAGLFEEALEATPEGRLPPGLGSPLGARASLLSSRLARLESALRRASTELSGHEAPDAAAGRHDSERALRSLLAVERLREEVDACLAAGPGDVVWVAQGERPALRSAPLDVAPVLSTQVFSVMPVVLTSATLVPGLAIRLGAGAERLDELDIGSPFDYERHAVLYCASSLPDRRDVAFEPAVHDEIETLVKAAGGRTLALFTSRRAMEAAAAALRPRLSWPVHLQGDLPKAALLQLFTSEASSCLFATMSFWQGIDVPGPSLSLVVIDRIPFPRPDEPLVAARREAAGEGGFRSVDLPRAAMLLAQGAGRLVRRSDDKGVVAVLDRRLATAPYSGYLVKVLPRMHRTRSQAEAVTFLQSVAAEAQ